MPKSETRPGHVIVYPGPGYLPRLRVQKAADGSMVFTTSRQDKGGVTDTVIALEGGQAREVAEWILSSSTTLDNGVELTPELFEKTLMSIQGMLPGRALWAYRRAFRSDPHRLYRATFDDIIEIRGTSFASWAMWTMTFERLKLRPEWVDEIEKNRGFKNAFAAECARVRFSEVNG
jgi:hypothetical protein